MDNQEALDIIQALSDGLNPFLNDALPSESICHNTAVNEALQLAIEGLQSKLKSEARHASLPTKAGEPWTDEEAQQVVAAYESGQTMAEIAKEHQRTKGAIQSRLEKLGKL